MKPRKKHPVRAAIHQRLAALRDQGACGDRGGGGYSTEMYVLERVLTFPFERYPDYCYPGHLLLWPSKRVRWGHIEQVIRFIEQLRQPTGTRKGEYVRLLGFQILILVCVLGPEGEDGLRVSRTIVMTIARKNAKTALVAMMFLAMMSLKQFDLRLEEIRIGAADREQAGKLFEMLRNMILLDTDFDLDDLYQITPSRKVIVHKRTMTSLKVISSDAHRAHGSNDFGVLLDELGNIPDNAARDFYSVLSTGFGTQHEPLLLLFSTQAANDSHIFSEFVDQAKSANTRKDTGARVTGFIFDLPSQDDGTGLVTEEDGKTVDAFAEENWSRSNPALEGTPSGAEVDALARVGAPLDSLGGAPSSGFRSTKDMRDKAREAREMPSLENQFRNLQLNQRVTAHSPFISQVAWSRCVTRTHLDAEVLDASELFIAGDLSKTTDLSALAYVWRLPAGKYYARVRPYTPSAGLVARARQSKVPYDTWVLQEFLTAIPGRTIDYARIARDLSDAGEGHMLVQVGFDRYKWDEVERECRSVGYEPYESEPGDFWVPIGQGYLGMSPCIEVLEKLILEEKIIIEDNPVATWAASNAVTVADPAGNRKFERVKSYGKIDPIVALAMAAWLAYDAALDARAGEGESAYEGQDLLVL